MKRVVWIVLTGIVGCSLAWSQVEVRQMMPFYGTLFSGSAGESLVYAGDCEITWVVTEQNDGSLLVRGAACFRDVPVRGIGSGRVYQIDDVVLDAVSLTAGKPTPTVAQIRVRGLDGAAVGLLEWHLTGSLDPAGKDMAQKLCVSCYISAS